MTRLNDTERAEVKAHLAAAKQNLSDAANQNPDVGPTSRELRERVNTLEDQLSLVKGRT